MRLILRIANFCPLVRMIACLIAHTAIVAEPIWAVDASKHKPAVPVPAVGTDWPLFRGDALATGVAKSSLAENPQVLWKFSAGKNGFQATAVIADGVVYVGSLDGNFYSIDLQAGTEKWHFHTELGFVASAAVRDNSIYAGDSDGKFYCLDGATGKPKWTFETGAEINSAPNFYQDSVLFGSQDATLYCLNRSSGTLVWKYTIGDQIRCSPTVVENRAFIAGCDGKLHIVDLDKGESAGSVMIDAPTGSTPGVLEDRVFFGTEGPTFYAIDWKNARIDWTFKPEKAMPFRSSAAVTSGAVVFGGQDKQVHALDLGGHELWKFSTRGRVDSSPVIVGERVFVGSADGRLYALGLTSGKKVWEYEAGGRFSASPAVVAGRLVIGNEDGTMYCFGAKK